MTDFCPVSSDTAVVCGNHINAHTLIRNLERLNWPGRLVVLRHKVEPAGLTGCLDPHVESWAIDIRTPDELPARIEPVMAVKAASSSFSPTSVITLPLQSGRWPIPIRLSGSIWVRSNT